MNTSLWPAWGEALIQKAFSEEENGRFLINQWPREGQNGIYLILNAGSFAYFNYVFETGG